MKLRAMMVSAALTTAVVLHGTAAWAQSYEASVPQALQSVVSEVAFNTALADLESVVSAGDFRRDIAVNIAASPCSGSISGFVNAVFSDRDRYGAILNLINDGFVDPPASYAMVNPWWVSAGDKAYAAMTAALVSHFVDWCAFLPQIEGDQDAGLKYILEFVWFYYRNPAGQMFSQGIDPMTGAADSMFSAFLEDFTNQRGDFMNTPASMGYVAQWLNDPRIEIEDYQKQQVSDYNSWNDFFAREITIDEETQTIPSRPTTLPERDYVVSAPTDCIMNPLVQVLDIGGEHGQVRALIENPLQADTVIDVKSYPISLSELLGDAPNALKQEFIGG
ncbi:MAG: hypothetical protein HOI34_15675 [Rhodospirillaceae bacterium]|nr:hypothetical protein [Rhodospirillaceae bacterium]MBT7614649.1 hypothetical protein [Rhodospirillaceae bacterium]MBT7646545.1 hypothetical protein [Rhodospirillaceae bacterium]